MVIIYNLQNTENHLGRRKLELLCDDSIKLDGGECRTLEKEIEMVRDDNKWLLAKESAREEVSYNEMRREYIIRLGAETLLGGALLSVLGSLLSFYTGEKHGKGNKLK